MVTKHCFLKGIFKIQNWFFFFNVVFVLFLSPSNEKLFSSSFAKSFWCLAYQLRFLSFIFHRKAPHLHTGSFCYLQLWINCCSTYPMPRAWISRNVCCQRPSRVRSSLTIGASVMYFFPFDLLCRMMLLTAKPDVNSIMVNSSAFLFNYTAVVPALDTIMASSDIFHKWDGAWRYVFGCWFLELWLALFIGLAMSTLLCFIIVINWIFCVFAMMHRLSYEDIMRADFFFFIYIYICIKNYIGTQAEDLSTVKVLWSPVSVCFSSF